jgi:hypothetical protein
MASVKHTFSFSFEILNTHVHTFGGGIGPHARP